MKIALISSEVVPYSKTGGLADVAGVLPFSLRRLSGCVVHVISPYYKTVKEGRFNLREARVISSISGTVDDESFSVLETERDGVAFHFIRKDEYYDRDGLYGSANGDHEDNAARFSFFCRASLALLADIEFFPDVIHINDWETALIPLYKGILFPKAHPLQKSRVLFTIHNLGYQGIFRKEMLSVMCLRSGEANHLIHRGRVNFMKAGIVCADVINTVSKKYAEEILTPEYGCTLEGILRKRRDALRGILNGADYKNWNPRTDKLIPVNYTAETLEKKQKCKLELMRRRDMDLPLAAPLIGSIGRLVEQKGIDIMIKAADGIVRAGAGFIVLGRGEVRFEKALHHMASRYKGVIDVCTEFDNKLAHMIEAGVDIFVMPSRYEPCGLNQMYSLKYGTIPVVRATGGLDDTIVDYSDDPQGANGFKFQKATTGDFLKALQRAIDVFGRKGEWVALQRRAMASDFSWERAARQYIALYQKMTA